MFHCEEEEASVFYSLDLLPISTSAQLQIFGFLDAPELAACQRVSLEWSKLGVIHSLWTRLAARRGEQWLTSKPMFNVARWDEIESQLELAERLERHLSRGCCKCGIPSTVAAKTR